MSTIYNPNSRVLATQQNKITRGFGNGHSGVDLGWQTTQTDGIIAHSAGTVTFCQTGYGNNQGSTGNASYGNCVKLKHANGYSTLYAHLSSVSVYYGQKVEKGQQIGRMGNTGNSYGTHLHFEVRNTSDTCINPAPYINADLPGLPTEPTKPIVETPVDYKVQITASDLNLRTGPGTNYSSKGAISPGYYTIVAEADGTGASKWGKISGNAGWVSLDYAKKVEEEPDLTEAQVQEIALKQINKYFDDLAKKGISDWAQPFVKAVIDNYIMTGDDASDPYGSFRPQDYITRQEVASVVTKALHLNSGVSDWAKAAWDKACEAGILDGTMPGQMLTREQFAVILDKLGLIDAYMENK